jgi:hypothetical protein
MFWKVAILFPISYCKSTLKANLFFSHEYEFSLSFCLQAFSVRMSSCWAIVARRFHGTAGGTHRQAGPQEVKTKAWVSSSQSNSVSPRPLVHSHHPALCASLAPTRRLWYGNLRSSQPASQPLCKVRSCRWFSSLSEGIRAVVGLSLEACMLARIECQIPVKGHY